MPIMKLPTPNGKTAWILHPHRVFFVIDHVTKDGCELRLSPHLETVEAGGDFNISGYTARQIKRSIQENVDTPIYFLKSVYYSKHQGQDVPRNIYFNTDYLSFITETEINKNPQPSVPGTALHFEASKHAWMLEHDHIHVATQLRRIANKLDQDEELCCSNLPTEEE